jgi:MHS family proline/betaine transporter-like MFS transporter
MGSTLPARPASLSRTVVAGAVGNVLEWYDFGLFGFFAPVIAQQFLPAEDRLASLLGTFGVFATGFLVRPVGGVVFGYIGDRLGRKWALELAVLFMAGSTTLLGLLPSYATIGVAAPFLLTLARLLQGLSVGGEYIGSMSFLVEHAPPGRRAFLGSWSSFSVVLGSLLGSGAAALSTGLLASDELATWGWRWPFLAGLLIGLVGFWLRRGVAESPTFLSAQKAGKLADNPLADAVRKDGRAILLTFGLTAVLAVGFYLPFIWLPTWLAHINRPAMPEHEALLASTLSLVVLLVLTPLSAWVADRVGGKPMFLLGTLAYGLLSYPAFWVMSGGTLGGALLGGLVFAVSCSLFAGCMAVMLVGLFPTQTCYTGVAIGYNGGQAVLGGTAPLVATALIQGTGYQLAPALYVMGAAVVAGLCCLLIPSRRA